MDKDSDNQATAPVTDDQAAVTDDQALADVLEGMNKTVSALEEPASGNGTGGEELQFEETPMTNAAQQAPEASADEAQQAPAEDSMVLPPVPAPETGTDQPEAQAEDQPATDETPSAEPELPTLTPPTLDAAAPNAADGELDTIKKDALSELRPLVDKLDLPPEEKFDTLLLIIRSTDDKSLVNAAHEAAKSIPDETRRANALLDIIKEIDYFSNPQQVA